VSVSFALDVEDRAKACVHPQLRRNERYLILAAGTLSSDIDFLQGNDVGIQLGKNPGDATG
jgi:hypothetical protein